MPVPTSIADLSKNAADNSPKGTESAKGTIDDYFRAHAGFIRLLADLVGGPTVTLPSADGVNIGFAASANITITGTTTINAFDNWPEGTLRWVTFAGALTLVQNPGVLQLPGASNIVTASGDVAVFKSLGGGTWKCVAYQRASGAGVIPSLPLTGGTISGPTIFNNNVPLLLKTTDGTPRQLFNLAADNTLNWTIPGGSTWNIYNQAGTALVWKLDNSGNVSSTGNTYFENTKGLWMKGTDGVARPLVNLGGDNNVNFSIIGGGGYFNFYNQAGSAVVASLSNVGDFVARTGTFNSDERLKKKWRRGPADLLQRVARLRKLGNFLWKKDGVPGIGASAQEFEEIWPEAVHTDAKGFKSFNYGPAAFVIAVELTRAFFRYVAKTDKRLAKLEGK